MHWRSMKPTGFILAILLIAGMGFSTASLAMTEAGTVIGNSATATYYDDSNNQYTTTSNLVQTIVAEVCGVETSGGGTRNGVPGQTVYVPFEVTNKGNGENTFSLAVDGAYSKTIYWDENQNGKIDPGESSVTSITLGIDVTAAVVVAVQVPVSATSGGSDSFSLTATGTAPGSCNASQSSTVDVIEDALIQTTKQVDKSVGAPGDTLSYTVSFKNVGTQKARAATTPVNVDGTNTDAILIKDEIPAGSSFVGSSASGQPGTNPTGYVVFSANGTTWFKTEAGAGSVNYVGFLMEDDAPTDGNNSFVLDPDQEGYISFQVSINDPFDDTDASVDNNATISYAVIDGSDKTVTTNTVHTVIPSSATADIAVGPSGNPEEDSGTNWQNDNVIASAPSGAWVTFTHTAKNRDVNNVDIINLSYENAPSGWIVEFWNAANTAKLIDNDADGKPDLGTVDPDTTKDFTVRIYIPGSETSGGSADIVALSSNNPSETDKSQDVVSAIATANVDLGKNGTLTDTTNDASDGDTDGTNDSDDVLPGNNGTGNVVDIVDPGETANYPLQVANTGASADTFKLDSTATMPTGTAVTFYSDPNCDGNASDGAQITDTPLLGGSLLAQDTNGTADIQVYDVANIVAGDKLLLDTGTASAEIVTVASVDVSTKVITLTAAPSNAHVTGAKVSESYCFVMVVSTDSTTPAGETNIVVSATSGVSGASNNMDAYLKVNAVCNVVIAPNQSDQLPSGGTTTYQHTVSNFGNTDANITISVPSSGTSMAYVILDSAAAAKGTSYALSNVAAGDSVTFYIKTIAPSNIPAGTVESINVTAISDIDNDATPDCNATAQDTTTIIDGYLQLTKYVSTADTNGTDAAGSCNNTPDGINPGPCDEITYRVKYKNIGNKDAVDVVLTDPIPEHTTYKPGSLHLNPSCDGTTFTVDPTDAASDDVAEYDGTNDLVRFRLGTGADATSGGTIIPGGEGCIVFKVTID